MRRKQKRNRRRQSDLERKAESIADSETKQDLTRYLNGKCGSFCYFRRWLEAHEQAMKEMLGG
jgi:hypothetical protein